jgi:hypothetical protein
MEEQLHAFLSSNPRWRRQYYQRPYCITLKDSPPRTKYAVMGHYRGRNILSQKDIELKLYAKLQ